MKQLFLILTLFLLVNWQQSYAQSDALRFKNEQMAYSQVKSAYINVGKILEDELAKRRIYTLGNYLLVRVFKREQEVEIWIRPMAANKYQLLETLKLCSNSGDVGPKATLSDQKIPEGFYEINRFAPEDPYLMALGIDYPNTADKYRNSPAANIEFRGGCKSSGSMPLGDEGIQKLYILALEAYSVGQASIPIHIFPTRMEGISFNNIIGSYSDKPETVRFWHNIKTGYDYFNLTKRLPNIETGRAGTYLFKDGDVRVVGPTNPVVVGSLNTDNPTVTEVPSSSTTVTSNDTPATGYIPSNAPPPSNGADTHIVQQGETLYGIAQKYRHSIYVIKKWNSLKDNLIQPGQTLKVAPPDYYVVKRGDTMYGISKRCGLGVQELLKLNNKRDTNLVIGEKLVVVK